MHLRCAPIIFPGEHDSCRSCFINKNFKNPVNETFCPACNITTSGVLFLKSTPDVVMFHFSLAPQFKKKLIDNLKIKCDKGASQLLNN